MDLLCKCGLEINRVDEDYKSGQDRACPVCGKKMIKTCRSGCKEVEWRGPGKNTCAVTGKVIYDQDKECLIEQQTKE